MSLSSRMIIVLTSIGLLSGGLLVGVDILTKERISLNKQREIEEAITTVVPGTKTSEKLYEEKDFTVYGGKNEQGEMLGFAIQAYAAGFQDKILLLVGLNPSLTKINRLFVIDQKETPGLGAKITSDEAFLKFWENKECTSSLRLRKPPAASAAQLSPSEVNTITGATVSSEAVLSCINSSLEKVKKLKAEGKFGGDGKNGS